MKSKFYSEIQVLQEIQDENTNKIDFILKPVLLVCKGKKVLVAQLCLTLCDPMVTGLLCPWNSPGKNTGVNSHSLLQGIFPTQWSNPGLLHCRQFLYHLSHQGSPILIIANIYRALILKCFICIHWILKQYHWSRHSYYNSHFTEEKSETWGSWGVCRKKLGW